MKSNSVKQIASLLAALIVLQGCTVYKGSISLEQAVASQGKVKLINQNNQVYEFQQIVVREGDHIGLPKRYGKEGEVIIDTNSIKEIREHDKTGSTLLSFTPLAVIVGLGIVLFTNSTDGVYD